MRILYFGDLDPGGTCLMRMKAFQGLGHDVTPVSVTRSMGRAELLWLRVSYRLKRPIDPTGANARVRQLAASSEFDVMWVDKGQTLRPATLHAFRQLQPQALVLGYSPDDMASAHNQTRYFLDCLPLYDAYFTTKTYGVGELRALGARRVYFNGNGYDPAVHQPLVLSDEDRGLYETDVGFVGAFEDDRAQQMLHLARNGIRVRIIGEARWRRFGARHPEMSKPRPSVYRDEYAKALCGAKINLCFLRKINRDLQTSRSIEIPACGRFMLAERTDEHMALFEEGREAEFFSSKDELLDKVRFYLANPDARERIAEAGRARCLASGYSYPERMREALSKVDEVRAAHV